MQLYQNLTDIIEFKSDIKINTTVIVLTYNQENYIKQALKSVLMQKSKYNFNIIIGDDCSTDGTSEIVKDFAAKNKKISYYKNPINLGVTKNLQKAFSLCNCEFIAFCEGDDYWIKPNKLESQIDFLNKNKDCSGCFHHFIIYDQNTNTEKILDIKKHDTVKYNTKQIIENIIPSNFTTTVYRKDSLDLINPKIFDIFSVDWAFNIAISEFGLLACIDDYMSVYRIHDKGIWSGNKDKPLLLHKSIADYEKLFEGKYKEYFDKLKPKIVDQLEKKSKIINNNRRSIIDRKKSKKSLIHKEKLVMINTNTNVRTKARIKSTNRILIKKNIKLNNNIIQQSVIQQPNIYTKYQKLNVGCGGQYFNDGWLNIDMIEQKRPDYLQLDVLKDFPFKNIDLIYNEHFIEHLTKEEGIRFITNCFNALNPGGILRIATFDIGAIIDNCHSMNDQWKESCETESVGLGHLTKCEFLVATFSAWGHKFVYNSEELIESFKKGGFTNIKECDYHISDNPELCTRETRSYSTLIIEGCK